VWGGSSFIGKEKEAGDEAGRKKKASFLIKRKGNRLNKRGGGSKKRESLSPLPKEKKGEGGHTLTIPTYIYPAKRGKKKRRGESTLQEKRKKIQFSHFNT